MEDEEAMRAYFPLSFGKQSKSQIQPAFSVHSATRRTFIGQAAPSTSSASSTKGGAGASLPSLSSSKSWLSSLRNPKPTRGRFGDAGNGVAEHEQEDEDGAMVGPPRPPPEEEGEEDDVVVGPPRPPPNREEDEEEEAVMIGPPRPPLKPEENEEEEAVMIGPPRPPPQKSIMANSDLEDDSYAEFEVSPDDSFRVPLSNEIVLKGHSNVVSALAIDHSG